MAQCVFYQSVFLNWENYLKLEFNNRYGTAFIMHENFHNFRNKFKRLCYLELVFRFSYMLSPYRCSVHNIVLPNLNVKNLSWKPQTFQAFIWFSLSLFNILVFAAVIGLYFIQNVIYTQSYFGPKKHCVTYEVPEISLKHKETSCLHLCSMPIPSITVLN